MRPSRLWTIVLLTALLATVALLAYVVDIVAWLTLHVHTSTTLPR